MPPPSFVAEYESAWNDSMPPSVSTTTAAGDVLAAFGGIHNGSAQLNLPSGGGLTWTQQQYRKPSNSYCTAYLWSAAPSSAATFNTSLTKVATDSSLLAINILRFSGSSGIGATANNSASSGAPTLTLTTTQANSAIVMLVLDWNGTSGARTYRTTNAGAFTELSYYQASAWTAQGGYYPDAGAAGTKTIGISAPSGQKYTIVAMEVLGAAGMEANAGNASGTFNFTGVATGSRASQGNAAGSHTWTGAATGSTGHRGAANGTYAYTGTAAGSTIRSGDASGTYAFDGAAVGSAVHAGTAGGTYAYTGAATGSTVHTGTAAGSFTFAGAATGTAPSVDAHSGSASGMYAFTGSATGHAVHHGTASGTYTWTGAATGGQPGTVADRDIKILSTTEPVTGWQVTGPTSTWTATEPTHQAITTTEPATAWAATEPSH